MAFSRMQISCAGEQGRAAPHRQHREIRQTPLKQCVWHFGHPKARPRVPATLRALEAHSLQRDPDRPIR